LKYTIICKIQFSIWIHKNIIQICGWSSNLLDHSVKTCKCTNFRSLIISLERNFDNLMRCIFLYDILCNTIIFKAKLYNQWFCYSEQYLNKKHVILFLLQTKYLWKFSLNICFVKNYYWYNISLNVYFFSTCSNLFFCN